MSVLYLRCVCVVFVLGVHNVVMLGLWRVCVVFVICVYNVLFASC